MILAKALALASLPVMPEELAEPPIKSRRAKLNEHVASRSVHFDNAKAKSSPSQEASIPRNTQPESHPQVGLPNLNQPPSDHWFTAVDPTRSVNCQPSLQTASAPPHPALPRQYFYPTITPFTGLPNTAPMGDYQNCAPPPTGVNFQPPVPDTTFGSIPHVYVPRFDGPVQQPVGALPIPQQSYMAQQGYMAQPSYVPLVQHQPVVLNGQAYVPASQPVMGAATPVMATAPAGVGVTTGVPFVPGNPTTSSIPDVSGLGRTSGEETLRQVEFAYNNRLFEPQDFKPADDDPSRFYYVREVDGNWTQRNRFSIDHMGDCRWYVTDEGWFYAVRLPD